MPTTQSPIYGGSRTRQVTFAASFAAVYFILRSVPTFQMVGISGRFTAGDFLLTTIAVLGGPWSGAISVLIGTILSFEIRPPSFFGLDFLPGMANVAIAGFVFHGHTRIARVAYGAAFLAFVLSPYSLLFGYSYVPYAWLHIIALILLLSPVASKVPEWVRVGGMRQVAGVGLLAFVGTMGQHLLGGLLFELVAGPAAVVLFQGIFWLYPLERLLIVALSIIIALGLQQSLQKWTPQSTITGER